jgi:apolipoprotein N-acyltransferase
VTVASTQNPPMSLVRLAHAVVLSYGWQRAAIALGAGAASTLAMAPVTAWPVLFVTFPILVWLVDGSAAGRWGGTLNAALVGWCFGFGYFVCGLYWIGYAFLVDAKTFAWLLPFAIAGLPAYLALFTGLGLALARLLWVRGPLRILALAIALTAAEWLRGHLLSGFPWNTFGYALSAPLALAQSVSLIGVWGLTFVTIAIAATPAVLAADKADTRAPGRAPGLALMLLAAMGAYGAARLSVYPTHFVKDVKLRLMQPNLQQDQKFNYAAKDEVMQRYLRLSASSTGPGREGLDGITHLIWPEAAFPFFLTREPDVLAQIASLVRPKTQLITGAVRAIETGSRVTGAFNSIYVVEADGSIGGIYDKVHLVPFGEYLPFEPLMEKIGLVSLTKQVGGFSSGDRRRALPVAGAPTMLPLICYEAIFPEEAMPAGERPGWILNLTNDGWFGISSGPYQHFQQARLLAIAEGLPLVRVANTGISAVVDPVGRVIRSLPLGSEGVLDSGLPQALPPTIFADYGNAGFILILLVSGALLGRRRILV